MAGWLKSKEELIAEQKQLAAATAEVNRQLLERAEVDKIRAQLAELEDKQRNVPGEIDKVRLSQAAEEKKIHAAHDAKRDLLTAAEGHVRTAETVVEDHEKQLKAAQLNLDALKSCADELNLNLDTLKSHVEELKSDMVADRLQVRNALHELNEATQSKINSLNSVQIELAQKREELQQLDPEFSAESVTNESSSSSETAQPHPKEAEHLIEMETAAQQATHNAEMMPGEAMVTQSTATAQATPDSTSRKPIVGRTTSHTDASARRSLISTCNADTSPPFFTCDTPAREVIPSSRPRSPHPPVHTPAATNGGNLNSDSDAQQSQSTTNSHLPQNSEETGNTRSESQTDPLPQPRTRNRESVSALTQEKLALKSEYADLRAALKGTSGARSTAKSQSTPKPPVFAKAADESTSTDKEKRKSAGSDQKPSTVYGEEVHECSLSEEFPTVIYIQEPEDVRGAWCELRCFVCHANTSVEQLEFFASITSFVQHIARSHGSFPREEVAAACVRRQFSADDVKRLLDGKQPLRGAPIKTTFGEAHRRALKLEDGIIADPHDTSSDSASPDQHKNQAMEEMQDGAHENLRGRNDDVGSRARAFQPLMRGSRVVELGDSEDELATPAAANAHAKASTFFRKGQSTIAGPTTRSQPTLQSESPAEQNVVGKKTPNVLGQPFIPSQIGQRSKTAAPNVGAPDTDVEARNMAPPRSSSLFRERDKDVVGLSSAIVPTRENSGFFKPFASGQKRYHGEMTPPKEPRRSDILHPNFTATAQVQGQWCIISCRICSANADFYSNGGFRFFHGLDGLFDHAKKSHPRVRIDRNVLFDFAESLPVPRRFVVGASRLADLEIVPHAGNKVRGTPHSDAVPAWNTNILHRDFPTTAYFDENWFEISCRLCSANAASLSSPFKGLIGLAAHVRSVHKTVTDFNDVRAWCAMAGPIDNDLVKRLSRPGWSGSYKIDLIVASSAQGESSFRAPVGRTSSGSFRPSKEQSRDPRLQNRIEHAGEHMQEEVVQHAERSPPHHALQNSNGATKRLGQHSNMPPGSTSEKPAWIRNSSASPEHKKNRREVEIEFRSR
ncbi:unnamed protein product [Cercospora beticola]|nr:unnamed protein product [Cercospora beticola]